jgi:DNA-binding XRE family transcriptional regulator
VTTPVQQAREALGDRLREIRKDAELTAQALAAALHMHFTKVSKIENGARSPSGKASELGARPKPGRVSRTRSVPDLLLMGAGAGAMMAGTAGSGQGLEPVP